MLDDMKNDANTYAQHRARVVCNIDEHRADIAGVVELADVDALATVTLSPSAVTSSVRCMA